MTQTSALRCRTLDSESAPVARARYVAPELALAVERVPRPEGPTRRASIDTLTIAFTVPENALAGLDAYTNADLWRREDLAVPDVDRYGSLACAGPFDEHGIASLGAGPVGYVYDERESVLKLELANGAPVTHSRCLSCVVAGLAEDGELLELWITGLER